MFISDINNQLTPIMSAPKANPTQAAAASADNLDEIPILLARRLPMPINDNDTQLPEIVVSANPIPWYLWAGLGAVLILVLTARK